MDRGPAEFHCLGLSVKSRQSNLLTQALQRTQGDCSFALSVKLTCSLDSFPLSSVTELGRSLSVSPVSAGPSSFSSPPPLLSACFHLQLLGNYTLSSLMFMVAKNACWLHICVWMEESGWISRKWPLMNVNTTLIKHFYCHILCSVRHWTAGIMLPQLIKECSNIIPLSKLLPIITSSRKCSGDLMH